MRESLDIEVHLPAWYISTRPTLELFDSDLSIVDGSQATQSFISSFFIVELYVSVAKRLAVAVVSDYTTENLAKWLTFIFELLASNCWRKSIEVQVSFRLDSSEVFLEAYSYFFAKNVQMIQGVLCSFSIFFNSKVDEGKTSVFTRVVVSFNGCRDDL